MSSQAKPFLMGSETEYAIAGRGAAGQIHADDLYRMLAEVSRRLSEEERLLAELRADGCEWTDIAARLGGTTEARRKQLARAVNRVEQQLMGRGIGDD